MKRGDSTRRLGDFALSGVSEPIEGIVMSILPIHSFH